ncbi:hypothetical protein BOTBODRAFT_125406 [Botryobasidium botryosum FD-172 SS1]|uniref:Uncharacterized protein n=1 Tax=Botryobasidium botryosum (strain FD-172 SS1) TaxID=930990 RepID=A0A067N832_BOTB1|nr:hypothetical protein BOTBODRAFT_125406 [Botryobasidium botryosum FD-172 SS1]
MCTDARVFGTMLGLDDPPKFKAKKIPKEESMELIGDISVSVREVNVKWNASTGGFKLSGSYGRFHL